MKNDFSKLKRTIFLQVLRIGLISIGIGVLFQYLIIDGILYGAISGNLIQFIMEFLRIDYDNAYRLYHQLFRSQRPFILFLGLFLLLLFIFYRALSRFTQYFNEVIGGVDKLVEEHGDDIVLSSELDFMSSKLNRIKNILEKRTKDAQDAEQRKNDLVVYLAHDIKTPLTSIIGYLNLLDEAPDMPIRQRAKYTKITLDKAYRLEHLINEFFEITRFNLQSIVLSREDINLQYMLLQMTDEFYPVLNHQGKKALVDIPPELTLYGDGDKLARVFNNILKNAIAYSYDDSTITISAEEAEDQIMITFTNYGKVIPPQKLNTIFEKFYRLDRARSSATGGTGLGLAIAKEIVMAHQGSIEVESNEQHTRFTLIFPKQE